MRKAIWFLLIILSFVSCKKEGKTSSFVVNINGTQHNFVVYPSDPTTAVHGVSIINYIPSQPDLPAYYFLQLHLDGAAGTNEIRLSLPDLQMRNTSYDSTYYFNQFNAIVINGIIYRTTSVHINNVDISLSSHFWSGEQLNSIASGSLDLDFNINGGKMSIKGSFKNIFANQ
jgi:hypothetical protein